MKITTLNLRKNQGNRGPLALITHLYGTDFLSHSFKQSVWDLFVYPLPHAQETCDQLESESDED